MTSGTARRDPATDEEFLAQLYKGGELLAAGKVNEAKSHLERAYELSPKNEKAQNLLGLTYFKLGIFDRASEIYELLVNDNPADPTLRVNLGLVYLKTNNLQRSVREFETATDLEPGHKKAHNYLGLALAQAGDYARAREHFVISGSEAMADKMARAMVSAEMPGTVKMEPPPSVPHPPIPHPPTTAPMRRMPPAEEQIEMMSAEEDVPPEADVPPTPEPPSPTTLVAQAQSLGGANGPPLPQPGFEELPELDAPATAAPALQSDWGAQFGMDPDPIPAPAAALPPKLPPRKAPEKRHASDEEMKFAEDEGPSQATSEAAVATGMQVPASVMTETSSDEMPMVDSVEVIEATVEELPVEVMPDSEPALAIEDGGWAGADEPVAVEEPAVSDAEREMVGAPTLTAEEEMVGRPRADAELELTGSRPSAPLPAWVTTQAAEVLPIDAATQTWSESSEEVAQQAQSTERWTDQQAAVSAYEASQPQEGSDENSQPADGSYETSHPSPNSDESSLAADGSDGSSQPAPDSYESSQPAPGSYEPSQPAPGSYESSQPAPGSDESSKSPPSSYESSQSTVRSYEASQAAPQPPEVQPGFQAIAVPKLADLGPRLDYGQSSASGPFHVGPEGLAVTVNGEMLSRLTGLVATVGGIDAHPEMRRNRGRPIDQTFGEGPSQLQRVKGYGTLYLEPGKASFQAIDLDDEGCYLREERVFAFEEAVAFENGRLTAGTIAVDMVHLKGHGAVLLRLEGTLKAMVVPPGTPLKVPLARLVGWYGNVSPRVMMGFVGQATVELTGDGYALLAAPA